MQNLDPTEFSDWLTRNVHSNPYCTTKMARVVNAVSVMFLSRRAERTDRVYDDRCIDINGNSWEWDENVYSRASFPWTIGITRPSFLDNLTLAFNPQLAIAHWWADQLRADQDTMTLHPVLFKLCYIRSASPQKSTNTLISTSFQLNRPKKIVVSKRKVVYDLSRWEDVRSGYWNHLVFTRAVKPF